MIIFTFIAFTLSLLLILHCCQLYSKINNLKTQQDVSISSAISQIEKYRSNVFNQLSKKDKTKDVQLSPEFNQVIGYDSSLIILKAFLKYNESTLTTKE
jgi:hypothetical protein